MDLRNRVGSVGSPVMQFVYFWKDIHRLKWHIITGVAGNQCRRPILPRDLFEPPLKFCLLPRDLFELPRDLPRDLFEPPLKKIR
jgi:hypothetical protein